MICSACKYEFTGEEAKVACTTCASSGGCGKARCPKCGYETITEPGVIGLMRRLFRRRPAVVDADVVTQSAPGNCCGEVNLADLKRGESGIIEKYAEIAHVRKFLSMGILPGTHVTVLRHSPAVVLRVGYSEFAFDRRLAGTVQVHRLPVG
ncbi:MAG: FeoA family protein [Candidatus Sumerlaeaceae bacterium]